VCPAGFQLIEPDVRQISAFDMHVARDSFSALVSEPAISPGSMSVTVKKVQIRRRVAIQRWAGADDGRYLAAIQARPHGRGCGR